MKTLKSLSIALLAGMLFVLAAPAQTILTQTTLSAKIADTSTKVITLTSATGVSAPTMPSIQANNLGSVLYIDRELMDVQAVNGTYITVRRAAGSTKAKAHASGALVFIGTPNQFFVAPPSAGGGDPGGACTRTSETVLPYINVTTGNISDCLGGQWVVGVRTANTPYRLNFPATGAVANTSLGTSTSVGATTVYCTEVNLPFNKLLTGIAVLNGTTNTNDHRYVILYDSTGNVIANSATTGTVTATNSVYQARAFTTKYYAVGPAQYFACFQDSVGSDAVMMAVTGTNDNLLTAGQTGATFGTIPALTVPTSFTTAVGPYVYLY
ncbi:MAG: hypothetical protein ABSF62_02330 [Bryobacteraceae bacterium]|jgi:hypothetical protein